MKRLVSAIYIISFTLVLGYIKGGGPPPFFLFSCECLFALVNIYGKKDN